MFLLILNFNNYIPSLLRENRYLKLESFIVKKNTVYLECKLKFITDNALSK